MSNSGGGATSAEGNGSVWLAQGMYDAGGRESRAPPATQQKTTSAAPSQPSNGLQVRFEKANDLFDLKARMEGGGGGEHEDGGHRKSVLTLGSDSRINSTFEAVERQRSRGPTNKTSVEASDRDVHPSKRKWIIDPRTNRYIGYWDVVTSIALLFTALVTPVEVAFLQPETNFEQKAQNALFWTNRLVDLVFISDMALQFFLAFPAGGEIGMHWVLNHHEIVRHYMLSRWFFLDFFSVSTSAFDIAGNDETSGLMGLRAARVLRLSKLVRLSRGSRIFKRWEMRVSINYSYLSLANISTGIVLVSHWFACIWGLQAQFTGNMLGAWPGATGYCVPHEPDDAVDGVYTMEQARGLGCPADSMCDFGTCDGSGNCSGGWKCVSWGEMYSFSLYWSVMTITSVGYGDIMATKFNVAEQVICSLMMLFGGMLWGYLIGTFCGLAASLSPSVIAFRNLLSQLNQFMAQHRIPSEMRFRLREYIHQTNHLANTETQNFLIARLSPAMQGEVAWLTNKVWLTKIWFLRVAEKEMLIELASTLSAMVFAPEEPCPPGFLYVVQRGSVFWGGRVIRAGGIWGDDVLLDAESLRLNIPALALTYLWVYVIDGQTLRSLGKKYPDTAKALAKIRIRWTMHRSFVRAAEQVRGHQFRSRLMSAVAGKGTRAVPLSSVNELAINSTDSRHVQGLISLKRVKQRVDRVLTKAKDNKEISSDIDRMQKDLTTLKSNVNGLHKDMVLLNSNLIALMHHIGAASNNSMQGDGSHRSSDPSHDETGKPPGSTTSKLEA